ncbi:ABC transporter substrate-binding protein [Actinoplanes couchii]|uniref:ABC transporter substrate-binding protein n=1 Tax=Actinoplanes couchii TaxID=403638 RepID=A0ABQ3XSV9_9ACTN|nr:ABC transporter substrate-binding protein [Actinoplanes couchii]MDR6320067.1 ABC-type nitrate/sulfonate/bicarbonate transport system substrate-binding protein [Actinoplanes couchii]GID61462.1 ABC transporter substrate-binding protein [Actinoplanes couchii]
MRSLLTLVMVAATAVAATPATAATPTPDLVRVRSASRSLPMLAGVAGGFFAAERLDVDYAQFVSSRPTFVQVDQQEIEFIVSSMDNAINYQLNPGNPAGRILDNVIVAAHDLGLGLALTAAPGYPDATSLRGKRVGVDVPHSGFGLPAEKILLEQGLVADTDYTLVSAGSTPARYQGLLDGSWESAIINAEGVVRARAAGLPVIGTVADYFDAYQGGIVAGNREWLAAHRSVAVRFLRAYVRAMVWLFDPRHRDAAIALLVDTETPPELAAAIYDLNVSADGLARRGALSPAGFRAVLELRNEFHGFETPQDIDRLASPEGGLYDLTYYNRAVGH